LGIIIFLLVAGISFMGLVGYFLYNMKYGNAISLYQEYNKKITANDIDTTGFIREHSPVFGPEDAPVVIFAFEDFECPYCRDSFLTIKNIKQKYGSALKIVFKHTPIVSTHPNALLAHAAAACAHDQGKFWDYYDLLYTSQKLDKESLLGYAELLSINNSKFQQCLGSTIHLETIEADLSDAARINLQGTPTYIVNGALIEGTLSENEWSKLILQKLEKN